MRAMKAVIADPGLPWSRDRMARVAFYTPRVFALMFNSYTGSTIPRFMRRARVEAAKRLLEDTDWTLQIIGRAVGLSSDRALVVAFRTETGVPPDAYRRRMRGLAPRSRAGYIARALNRAARDS